MLNILDIWHRRLGHINEKYIRIVCPFIPKYLSLSFCPYCAVAKLTKTPLKKTKISLPTNIQSQKQPKHKSTKLSSKQIANISNYNAYKPGECICVDLKHMPTSIDGDNYLCTFTCTSSRLADTVYLKTRTAIEFLEHYKIYCKYIRNKTGKYPKYIYSDNGKEFVYKHTALYNQSKGITHATTSPHSSLQNSIAERINRTLGEGSIALLVCANLPLTFWIYSIAFFNFVKGRTPHKSLNYSNPITTWNIFATHRTSIDLYDLRIFGSEAYVLDENTLKNNPKAFRCIYLGPCLTQKGCKFFNLHTSKIFVSRNFVINEQCYPGRKLFPNIYDKYLGISKTNTSLPTTTSIPSTTNQQNDIPTCSLHNVTDSMCNDVINDDSVNYFDVDNISVFDRNIQSRVGPSDLPSLPTPIKKELPPVVSPTVSPVASPTVSLIPPLDSVSPIPPVDSSTPVSPSAPKVDNVNYPFQEEVHELWEIDGIIGKRKTKFGRTKTGKWKYGGGEWDYEVKWSNGDPPSFQPETLLKLYVPEAIDEFNKQLEKSTTVNPSSEVSDEKSSSSVPEEIPQLSSSSFARLRNFVCFPLFCLLAKIIVPTCTKWKSIKVPTTRAEMLRSPEREQWLKGERKELDEIASKETWRKVKRPKKKPISCRWVYKLKPPTTLQPEPIFKCRLVAHGYKQQAEIDYSSTFAQVATLKAFRILMWLSVIFGYRATQMDVKNAFLAGTLDKEIYMTAPPGYEREIGCVLLVKSLYGLKQAPRIWYKTLVSKFHSLGFKEIVSDSCVFRHHTERCFILVFVDDIIIYSKNEKFRTKIERDLQLSFDLKLLGTLRYFIGLHIDTDKHGNVHIHQHDYIQKLKDVFKCFFVGKTSVNTPYEPNTKFSKSQQPTVNSSTHKKMSSYPYRQLIGSLLYLLGTRPEIYFIVITLSKFVINPAYLHWLAALRVLFYVCSTPLYGLFIRVKQNFVLSVYVDSDHGGNIDDRKSISGYIIYLGTTPIVWRSRQQKGKPAESSCEAEYISLSACINEVVWIIFFLSELGFKLPTPVPIYCDNKSAKDLAYNPVHHDRTKHIDIRYHRIREFILDGTVSILYVKSENNPSDLFTKTVTTSVFNKLISRVYGKFE